MGVRSQFRVAGFLGVSHWFLGSDHNFTAQRSAAPAGRAEGSGNLCSDPENARFRICLSPFGLSLSKPCSSSICWLFDESDAALSPRRATHFLLLRQKKVSQEKATLVPASLRCATGQPAVLSPAGVSCKLAALKQARALFRLALRSSAHSQGGWSEFGFGEH